MPGEEYSFPIVIEPTFDVRLIVATDDSSASLYVRKAADRKHEIDLKLISNVINNSHLKGLDPAQIRAKLLEFRDSAAMELEFPIAEGTPPGRGPDRELEANVEWLDAERVEAVKPALARYDEARLREDAVKLFPVGEAARFAQVEAGTLAYGLSAAEPGECGTDVYGREIPGLPGNDPFIQLMGNLALSKEGITARETGILMAAENPDGLKLRLVPYLDGKATPIVAEDGMSVSVILESEAGAGHALSLDLAVQALDQAGIHGEIDRAAIEAAIADVHATKRNAEIVVLRGKRPIKAGGTRITWHCAEPEAGKNAQVKANDLILEMEILPSGENGFDIHGKVLTPAEATPVDVPEHDDSIKEETVAGKKTYVALKSGELSKSGTRLSISGTRTVDGDLGEQSEDISFPGDLVINGKIGNGRMVKAAGSLTVTGDAGGALLSADESVTMRGGISGAGRGVVWAKQAIKIAYAENARLLAGQDIHVDNYCFQCTVKTNGTLFMSGQPGVLLGGNVRASKGAEVNALGSEKTIRTSVSFGQNYLVSDQIEVCEKDMAKIQDSVARIDAEMQRTSSTDPRIHTLRRKKLDLLKHNDKLKVRIFTLKEQFETHILSHIRVEGTVYPGVILESHGRYLEIRERKTHVVFFFDQITGQIVCKPIDD